MKRPTRQRLTDTAIRRFNDLPGPRARAYLWDAEIPQLAVQLTSRGVKTFVVRVTWGNQQPRVRLGQYPAMTVDEARQEAAAVLSAARRGVDPRDALRLSGARPAGNTTLREFWTIYLEEYGRRARKRWDLSDADVARYWGPLLDFPLGSITPDQVRRWYHDLGDNRGPAVADAQVNLLRAVYNKARGFRDARGLPYAVSNPADADVVPRVFARRQRDRYLNAPELRRLFHVVAETEDPAIRHGVRLALYTGARHANLAAMRWQDIDLDQGLWIIPAGWFKSQSTKPRSHVVPLVTQALQVLRLRRDIYLGEWVFPSSRGGGHLADFDRPWRAMRRAAGLDDVVFHDLRRTAASWMVQTNASLEVVGAFLGHKASGITAIYARLAVEPIRTAAQLAVDTMHREAGVED